MTRTTLYGSAAFAAYIATIPASNWLVAQVGNTPVGFGLIAPAGVWMVGLALVLRDVTREALGGAAALLAVFIGGVLSWFLASPLLAMASTTAFLLSELLDFGVYEPLRKRGLITAMVASNLVGLVADSVTFLWMAFGSLAFLPGQLVGKAWMTVIAISVIVLMRQRRTAVAA